MMDIELIKQKQEERYREYMESLPKMRRDMMIQDIENAIILIVGVGGLLYFLYSYLVIFPYAH